MIKVLFVCLGNICRSPMAEAVMRYKVSAAGLADEITVDSAGTGNWHAGEAPHIGAREQLDIAGIPHTGIYARQLTRSDIGGFDYIIAMDEANLRDILRLSPSKGNSGVFLLSDFIDGCVWKSVPDPWYTGNFKLTYELIDEGCEALLNRIRRAY